MKRMLVTPSLHGILEFRSGSASHVELSRNAGEVAVITGGVLTAVLSTLLSLCPWSGECQHLTRDTSHVTRHICRDKEGNKCQRNQEYPGSGGSHGYHHLHFHSASHTGITQTKISGSRDVGCLIVRMSQTIVP